VIKIEAIKEGNLGFDDIVKLYGEKKLNNYNINLFCLLKPGDYKELERVFLKDIEFVYWSTSQKARDRLFKDIKRDIENHNSLMVIINDLDDFRERLSQVLALNLRKENSIESFLKILAVYMDLLFFNSNVYGKSINVSTWKYDDEFFLYCGNNKYNCDEIVKKYDSFLKSHTGKYMSKQLIIFLIKED